MKGGGSAICICVYGCAFKISRTIRLYNYLIEVREGETESERKGNIACCSSLVVVVN